MIDVLFWSGYYLGLIGLGLYLIAHIGAFIYFIYSIFSKKTAL